MSIFQLHRSNRPACVSILFAVILNLGNVVGTLDATELSIGSPAPTLSGVTWVQGVPISPAGKLTIVIFWASIVPADRDCFRQLSALQGRFHDQVQIAALSRETVDAIKAFIKNMHTSPSFSIGIADTATSTAYTGSFAIFSTDPDEAFLIDSKGQILWIGSGEEIETPLAAVIGKTYDIERQKHIDKLISEIVPLVESNDPDAAKITPKLDELENLDPLNQYEIETRLWLASDYNKPEQARAFLQRIPVERLSAPQANKLAWARATDESLTFRNLDLALVFSRHAIALDPESVNYIDTMARLQYDLGDVSAAIATESHVVDIDEQHNETYKVALDYYRSVAKLQSQLKEDSSKPTLPVSSTGH